MVKQFLTLFPVTTLIIGNHMVQEITPCAEKPTIQINCRLAAEPAMGGTQAAKAQRLKLHLSKKSGETIDEVER
jgi:hypothetical protein